MTVRLEIIYGYNTISYSEAWEGMRDSVCEHTPDGLCRFNDEKLSKYEIGPALRRRNRPYFEVTAGTLCVRFTTVQSASHVLVQITGLTDLSECSQWVSLLSRIGDFRQGWVVDVEYDYWQNAFDPLQYTSKGKSYSELPLISNDAPPPLQKTIIDISENPGRRVVRNGYVEAVGATMWFGGSFWGFVPCRQEDLYSADWLSVSILGSGDIRVDSFGFPFRTADGGEGELQRNLRMLIFHR